MITEKFLNGRVRHGLNAAELATLDSAVSDVRILSNGDDIVRRGQRVDFSTYLVEGYMIRSVMDKEGGRQILGLHIPGDFLDLHAFPLKRLDHDVSATGEAKVALVPHKRLREIVAEQPHLTRILWYSTLLDAAMHREWIFRLGRLDALGRVAHFLCETEMRLRFVELSDGAAFPMPLSQREIADVCGITAVHMSRTMATLRKLDLVRFDGGMASIVDYQGLADIGEFDGDYLYGRHGGLFDDKYDE
jgi:CRP-like cAMP-binding protein